MAALFSDRLDFLMELTGTQASALARACTLDASHISRLRNGTRPLPRNPVFIPAMSRYLAKRVRLEYQKGVLCETMQLGCWPAEEKQGALLIEKLLMSDMGKTADITSFLNGFSAASLPDNADARQHEALPPPKSYYYGPAGKRDAVLQFLNLVQKEKTPQTLLLSSEEEMSWLYDDPAYAARWAADMKKVLQAGNRIKIIHNIGRDLNELVEAVAKWVPVYLTGMIEPYYYPKLRDGIFQRTLFLAPQTAAVVSTSVARKTDGMLNELITDKKAVAALTLEYERYVSLCRPLMRIFTAREADALWKVWSTLANAGGDLICMSGMPTLATMPVWVAEAMQKRAPGSRILALRNASAYGLEHLLPSFRYTELLSSSIHEADAALPCADFLGAPGMCYTADELQSHLASARELSERYENFHITERSDIPQNLLLYGREERGVIIAKTDVPGAAFAISEPSLTNALWDYLAGR